MPKRLRIALLLFTLFNLSGPALSAPAHVWSRKFGDSGGQEGTSVAIDPNGNVIFAGDEGSTSDYGGGPLTSAGGGDFAIAKFDRFGAHLWSRLFGDSEDQDVNAITTDADGNIIAVGAHRGTMDFGGGPLTSVDLTDIWVAKFDPDGNHLWSRSFHGPDIQSAQAVAADPDGNVIITGHSYVAVDLGGGPLASADAADVFLVKLDASGNHVWSKVIGGTADQYGNGVATDAAGDVLVVGRFRNTTNFGGGALVSAGVADIFVVKYDAAGSHLWSKRFGDAADQNGIAIATDAGDVYLGGTFSGSVDFGGGALVSAGGGDLFAAKLTATGAHVWSHSVGAGGAQVAHGIGVDEDGNCVVGGTWQLGATGDRDVYLAVFDPDGVQTFGQRYGDFGEQKGYALSVRGNRFAIAGGFAGQMDFGGGPLDGIPATDMFVASFSVEIATGLLPSPPALLLRNFPNPFNPRTTIEYTLARDSRVAIEIFDATGARIARLDAGAQPTGTHQVEWDGRDAAGRVVASGVYFYRIEGAAGAAPRKMLLAK